MPDQVHYETGMSVSNKLQTETTTSSIVDSAIANLQTASYIVLARQIDNTLDPGASPTSGDKYLITNSASLHANYGTVTGLQDNDILKYSGTAFIIDFNANVRGAGSFVSVIADNSIRYFDGSDWVTLQSLIGGDNPGLENVLAIQSDGTLDPTASPSEGARYLITDFSTVHANFGTVTSGADDDIWEYQDGEFVIVWAVASGEGYAVWSDAEDGRYYFTGTAWVKKDALDDHTSLLNIGTNTHAQLDTHVADATIHFTEAGLDHTAISNIGTNTHAQIDTHIAGDGSGHADVASNTLALADKEDTANKNATGGYAGLSLFKIMFNNAADTFTSFFTNTNTAVRTYTFQDRDGTIADDTDLALKEDTANKNVTGGYVGLTLFKIMFKNAADTFTSFFTNSNTAARTYTFQDRDGTISDDTDLALKAPLASPSFTGTLTAAGLVDISGVGAGQLKFPSTQNPSADANTLDDIEESTWTPHVVDDDLTSGEGQTYTVRQGSSYKVGSTIFFRIHIVMLSLGTLTLGNTARITLPVTSSSTANIEGGGYVSRCRDVGITANQSISFHISTGSAYGNLELWDSASGSSEMNLAKLSADGELIIIGQYEV